MRSPVESRLPLTVVNPGESVTVDGLLIETIPALHPVPTLTIRVPELGFVYTADTGFTDELVQLSQGAKLLLAEATYRAADGVDVSGHGHLDGHSVADLAAQAEVEHLVITHLADPDHMEDIHAEAATRFEGRITMAKPTKTFDLG